MQDKLLNDLDNRFGNRTKNLAINNDLEFLSFLLEQSKFNQEYKNRFFIQTSSNLIFKKDEFLEFLNLAILGGSYTKYSNKIGLSNGGRFLKINNEVVLNFPFKDCVLKGGQSKDNDKSKEIFFNEILARDEIDVLFAPKVLHNFKLIGKQERERERRL